MISTAHKDIDYRPSTSVYNDTKFIIVQLTDVYLNNPGHLIDSTLVMINLAAAATFIHFSLNL